jgi:HK97 family phage prohead protease
MKLVAVEPGGAVFRGLAVPFYQSAIVVEPDNRLVAEQFDPQSITELPANIPLLISHRRDEPPAGIIDTAAVTAYGLGVEGRLIGTDDELDGWRKRFAAGLMSSLSIGFVADGRQQWQRPQHRGDPPLVIRRGVRIIEISLVSWPAYTGAGIASLNQRTAAADIAHAESLRVIAETQRELIRTTHWLQSRRR